MNYTLTVIVTTHFGTSVSDLKSCIQSLIIQTQLPNQIVIVCDGPISPSLNEYINSIIDDKNVEIVVEHVLSNVGPGEARNIGVERSNSDLIAIMDSDDVCFGNRFELQMNVFRENKNVEIVGGQIIEIDSNHIDRVTQAQKSPSRKIYLNDYDIKSNSLSRVPVNNVTSMFKKQSFISAGGYPKLRFGEDIVLWHRMISKGCIFRNLDKNLVKVRVDEDFYSKRTGFRIFTQELKYLFYLRKENHVTTAYFLKSILKSSIVRFMPSPIYYKVRTSFNR